MIEVKDLSYSYTGKPVLDKVTFSLHAGEVVALLGAGGSGKSALLSCCAGLLPIRDGTISFSGRSFLCPGNISPTEEPLTDFVLSGRSLHKRIFRPYSAFDRQRADESIRALGCGDVSSTQLPELSDSSFKIAMIAHTLASDMPLVLFDNPEEGLDIHSRMLLNHTLKKYCIDGKHSVLFATNDINFASHCADRYLFLHKGSILTEGGSEIFTEDLVQKIYGVDSIITKNIYNGRPEVQFIPE